MKSLKNWKKGDLVKNEENLKKLQEKEQKALDKVKKDYENSKEKAIAKVAAGRMEGIKKEVEDMVTDWKPGDSEKGNDPDSMKKLFLNAMLKEIGGMLANMTEKVKAVEVKEPEKEKETEKEPKKEKETEKEPEKDTKMHANNEITTLFQLLHAENRNLRWK